jgi:hypothetical protein
MMTSVFLLLLQNSYKSKNQAVVLLQDSIREKKYIIYPKKGAIGTVSKKRRNTKGIAIP